MATLDSTSTLTQIEAEYADNASYSLNDSVSEAKAFVVACRFLLLKLPSEQAQQSDRVQLTENLKMIRDEMRAAQQYVSSNASSSVKNFGISDTFRG